MMIIVVYDINTTSQEGCRRLTKVSKECKKWGIRIQGSVFECLIDADQFREMQSNILKCIEKETDCVRFYILGNNYDSKIVQLGKQPIEFANRFIL